MTEKRTMMGFKAPIEIKSAVEEIAIQEDRTISYTLCMLLKLGIKEYREKVGTPSSKAEKVSCTWEVILYKREGDTPSQVLTPEKYKSKRGGGRGWQKYKRCLRRAGGESQLKPGATQPTTA